MERTFQYKIEKSDQGCTIKNFLSRNGYSNKNIIALKKMKESILINGRWEYVSYNLKEGDLLEVHIMENQQNEQILAVNLPFPIIYEDDDLMVINKPANMPTHPSLNNYDNSLANAAMFHFQKMNIPYTFRCINRLDKDTTGLTILAKHMISANLLSEMIKRREISREYRAIVSNHLPTQQGTVDAPIGRVSDSLITRKIDFENGEKAITHFQKLASGNDFDYVSLHLETGRTHQIRVHMSSLGCPLIGDYLYHPDYMESTNHVYPIKRQALHAYQLSFTHPITYESMCFTAPLPEDMKSIIESSLGSLPFSEPYEVSY